MKRPSPSIGLAFFLFSLASLLIVSFLFSILVPASDSMALSNWITLLMELGLYGLPIVFFYSRRPEMQPAMRWTPLSLRTGYCLAGAAMAGVYVFNFFSLLTTLLLTRLNLTVPPISAEPLHNFSELLMLIISTAAAPAVCEELLFRGMVLPSLETRGRRYALFFSALLFALPHGELAGFPSLFLLGLLLGALVIRTGCLMAPIIYHFFHNAYILSVNYLAQQAAASEAAAQPLTVSPSDLLSYLPGFLCFGLVWFFFLRSVFRSYPKPLPPLREKATWKDYVLTAVCTLALILLFLVTLLPMMNGGTF